MSENLPTDFDDEIDEDQIDNESKSSTPDDEQASGKDESGTPYCIRHHCRMKQTSGGGRGTKAAYFACPVKGCDEKAKRVKTNKESSIPNGPQCCPRCSKGKKRVVLERNKKISSTFYTVLQCPDCGFRSQPMPRPEFIAQQNRRPPVVADIGSR